MTGWKALFVNSGFSKRIDDVTKDESDVIMDYIKRVRSTRMMIADVPDLHAMPRLSG